MASTGIIAGNHNDAYNLKPHLQTAFKEMKRLGLALQGAYFNADMGFDTREARKKRMLKMLTTVFLNSRAFSEEKV